MTVVSVTPDNYQAVFAESSRRLVVLGFVDDYRLMGKFAADDEGAWLFAHVADTEQNRTLSERHDVSHRPTLVALRDGVELAHTRADNATEQRLREWLDSLLQASTSDIDTARTGAVIPRYPET